MPTRRTRADLDDRPAVLDRAALDARLRREMEDRLVEEPPPRPLPHTFQLRDFHGNVVGEFSAGPTRPLARRRRRG